MERPKGLSEKDGTRAKPGAATGGMAVKYKKRMTEVYGPYDTTTPAVSISYNTSVFPAYAVTANRIHYDDNRTESIDTVTYADGLARVIQVRKEAEVKKEGETETTYGMNVGGLVQYDALGRTIAEGQPLFLDGYDLSWTDITELNLPTVKTYDVLDRELSVTFPDGASVTKEYEYENSYLKMTVTDPEQNIQKIYSDSRGNTARILRYNKNEEIQTDYQYNGVGELKLTTDNMGNETVMTYDMAGRMTTVENGDSGLLEYIFDDAGNMRPETRRVEQ